MGLQRSLSVMVVFATLLTGCFLFDGGGEPKTATNGYGNLELRLWISRDRPRVGQAVDIQFTVINHGTGRLVIELPEASVMDIKVSTGVGIPSPIYWSDGREITPEMRRLELAPGESKTIEMTWVPSKEDQYAISTPIGGILRLQEGGTAEAGTTINVGGYRILP